MGLRFGRRTDQAWLKNIIAWSPASVWNSLANSTLDPFKDVALGQTFGRIKADETPQSRHDYFFEVFDQNLVLTPPQPQMWYRDDWKPCKQYYMDMARRDRREIYNAFFRCWHWRLAYEMLIFSHLDPDTPGGPPRYESIRINTLLASGEKDNYNFSNIYHATQDIAKDMVNTPGSTLFLLDTGHSIHNERPLVLARAIADFLQPKGKESKDGKEASKDRKDNKEIAKDKDNPKENLKEKDQDFAGQTGGRSVNSPYTFPPLLPGHDESSGQVIATGQAFIRPEERPAVGERVLRQSE